MNLTIAIVNYRTTNLLERCLKSIGAEDWSQPHEVIVVNNDPSDQEITRISSCFPAVRLIQNARNIGFGSAVNVAFRNSARDFFLVLNPDMEVAPDSLCNLLLYMQDHLDVALAAPKLINPDGSLQYSCRNDYALSTLLFRRTLLGILFPDHPVIRRHLMMDWDHAHIREVDWVLGAAMMLRRAALPKNEVFDERFFLYFEDVDLCLRLRQQGWKVMYNPQAIMIHHHRRSSARGDWNRAWIEHLKSWVKFEWKHRGVSLLRLY